MNMAILLGQISAQTENVLSEKEMIQQIHQAVQGAPAGGLRWVLILSVVSLVGILWLVHRQHRLARNQVKIATMLEDLSKRCDE
ncbi:MAG: hypothetical protein GWP14_05170 [Actinobacteria bacterium]|nr:hypothetical protein [Actinomycetota bacterium]